MPPSDWSGAAFIAILSIAAKAMTPQEMN